jgi:bifunctional pyridoxal-dependent enzyme with beta-cystathionase and maltose regulon repressor activities
LSAFRRLVPIPTALSQEVMLNCRKDIKIYLTGYQSKYKLDIDQVERSMHEQGLAVVLASNPRNPTGQVIEGEDLKRLVGCVRYSPAVDHALTVL